MKLIRVGHYRCDSVDEYTYIFSPDNKTTEDIENDINKVTDDYLSSLREFTLEKPMWPTTVLDRFNDELTVAEAKAQYKKELENFNNYQEEKGKIGRSFNDRMKDLGYKTLYEATEQEEFTAFWGHNHGESINTSSTILDYEPKKKL